ncbi:MAG: hypothetical protein KC420_16745, partial [Myxococcales bacterium]|nr:hypothetical protein [Myxococcales bacterium]
MVSLAVKYPRRVVTNEDIRRRSPAAGAARPTISTLWAGHRKSEAERGRWAAAMAPYLADPFRGTVVRRHLDPGETSRSLEVAAAREAIARSGGDAESIELVIAVSFLPDQVGVGNATFVCGELGLRAAAWNLESACSGTLVAYQTACALIRAGHFKRILIVASCAYSRYSEDDDTIGWFLGDGAAAMVVAEVPRGEGLLSQASRHTAELCGTFRFETRAVDGDARFVVRADASAGRRLAELQDGYLLGVAREALARAGVGVDALRLVVFNTPTAWFHDYVAALLEVEPARTTTTYPQIGNVGPVLLPANLHH